MFKSFSKRVLANLGSKAFGVPSIEGYAEHGLQLFFDQHNITETNLDCYKIDRCAPPFEHLFERVYAGKAKKDGRLIGLVILYDENTGFITGKCFPPSQSHLHLSVYRSYKQKNSNLDPSPHISLYFEMCGRFGTVLEDLHFDKYRDEQKSHSSTESSHPNPLNKKDGEQVEAKQPMSSPPKHSSPSLEEHNKRITKFVQSNNTDVAVKLNAKANKYADVKSSNNKSRRLQKKIPSIPKTNSVSASPESSAEAKAAKFEWLKDNATYFSRIKSQGRTLSEYQEGIIKKYEQLLADNPKSK